MHTLKLTMNSNGCRAFEFQSRKQSVSRAVDGQFFFLFQEYDLENVHSLQGRVRFYPLDFHELAEYI